MKKILAQKKREKEEERLARQRIKEQIAKDKVECLNLNNSFTLSVTIMAWCISWNINPFRLSDLPLRRKQRGQATCKM